MEVVAGEGSNVGQCAIPSGLVCVYARVWRCKKNAVGLKEKTASLCPELLSVAPG
jgi:hypothetical protein